MTIERPNPNWPGSTYNGFAGPALAAQAPPGEPSKRRRRAQAWMLGGIATAVAAGVALGFAAQPEPVPAEKAEAIATPLPIEMSAPAPTVVRSAGKLDVRPAVTPTQPAGAAVLAQSEGSGAAEPLSLPPAPERAVRRDRAEPPPEVEFDRPAEIDDGPPPYDDMEDPGEPY